MKINQTAAQLYTLREQLKTPADIATSLKKVKKIGYDAVQVSGMGPIDESDLVKILDDNGLSCCATHEPGDAIINDTAKVIDRLNKLNCKYTAYPHPSNAYFTNLQGVKKLAAQLDAAGAEMAKEGITLTYHNHSIEFQRVEGKTILQWLYDETATENLQGEIDTYWVQHGGGNPISWCKKLNGRLPLLHLKDYIVNEKSEPVFAEIGNGNLEWKSIIDAAEQAGCLWYIVEQDTCPADPFDSLKQSYNYIGENLCT